MALLKVKETIYCHNPFNSSTESLKVKTLVIEEVRKGLWSAIQEFLDKYNNQWTLHKRYTNNNGPTILKRINPPPLK